MPDAALAHFLCPPRCLFPLLSAVSLRCEEQEYLWEEGCAGVVTGRKWFTGGIHQKVSLTIRKFL